ncbi:MAG: glycosyltransferase [Candidatus Koribacter versatilis]|uniref:Glycosyltransferase n=1 Tax=Candidatus Korobacter versatilis TaxID=658062 RepID=A0A932A7J6_9BACT|nr:glycosyltransferase [Candidatus Koribacter versatilis]
MSDRAISVAGQQSEPEVSVIVPARNEEACIGTCLVSLVGQTGVTRELILVDDGSTDRTREIAAGFPEVRVLEAGPRGDGWGGKSNALWRAAQQARGAWLLFTDADTVHLPGSLARAVAEAKAADVALLSYSPEQEVRGVWENAVMPVIFAELAARFRPQDVCDPKSAAAAANGQYLLIAREAYFAVGGHAGVATSLLEDVELARALKRSGRAIGFRFGGDAVRTRMYRNFPQLCEGWTKNLALLFPSTVGLALLRMAEFVVIVGTVAVAMSELLRARVAPAGLLAVVAVMFYSLFFARIRRAHFGMGASLLALLGLPVFSLLLLRSHIHYKVRKSVTWKGREYEVKQPAEAGPR